MRTHPEPLVASAAGGFLPFDLLSIPVPGDTNTSNGALETPKASRARSPGDPGTGKDRQRDIEKKEERMKYLKTLSHTGSRLET
jgi:hypothetical protein